MFKLVIEATTTKELAEKTAYFLQNGFSNGNPAAPTGPAPADAQKAKVEDKPAPTLTPPATPKKAGRPPKAATPVAGPTAPSPAVPAPGAAAAAEKPAAAAAGPTLDAARAAMHAVSEKFGNQGLSLISEIITKHGGGATRISDVKPEHYAAVIGACEKAVA